MATQGNQGGQGGRFEQGNHCIEGQKACSAADVATCGANMAALANARPRVQAGGQESRGG